MFYFDLENGFKINKYCIEIIFRREKEGTEVVHSS